MLIFRSCTLPVTLHRAGSSSSSSSSSCRVTVTTQAIQHLQYTPTAFDRLMRTHAPTWVCWAQRSNSSSSSSSSRHQQTNNHKSGQTPGRSSSGSRYEDDGYPRRRKTNQQQQQQQSDVQSRFKGTSKAGSSSSGSSGGGRSPVSGNAISGSSSRQNKLYSRANGSSSSSISPSTPRSSPLPRNPVELLVIGAGAAGLTAAYFAARSGSKVTVLERTREAGKKILMSGGSRCNVLPLEVDLQMDYVTSSSSSAMRAVFSTWTLEQCLDWLANDIGLELLLEQETNKWFPASNSSREVRDRLVAACEKFGVKFVYNASVEEITPPTAAAAAVDHNNTAASNSSSSSSCQSWQIDLADGSKVSTSQIILSTGGRSFPAVGTDGTGLNILSRLGHKLIPQYAALTPLKGQHPGGQQLAGLTLSDVRLCVIKPNGKVGAVAQRGGLLFTHKGYSGPAILDLSHWLVREMEQQQQQPATAAAMPKLVVNWTNESPETWQQRLAAANGAATVEGFLKKSGIKERLAAALCLELGISGKLMSHLKKTERHGLLIALTAWQLPVTSHEGYKKAEVTGGGVTLAQIDCKTMESRLLPGLFLCGEVLDVFGRIGGFNFYWAWLTGRAAGLAAAAANSTTTIAAAAAARRV